MTEELALILLLAWAFGGSKGGGGSGPSPSPSSGGKPKVRTFVGNATAWVKDRYELAHALLSDQLPMQYDAEEISRSVVAHWGIETNWGANEFNFNLGGIHASKGQPFFASTDAGRPTNFVAYASAQDGAKGYADLLMHQFKACAMKLLADPELADWYVCLGTMGYYGKNPNAEKLYTDARARVAAILDGKAAP